MIEVTNFGSSEISLQNSNTSENFKKENEFSNLFIQKFNEPEISLSTLSYPVEPTPEKEIESELQVVDEENEKSDSEDNQEISKEKSTDQLLSHEGLTKVNLASEKKNMFENLKEEENILNVAEALNDKEKYFPKAELNSEIEKLIQMDENLSIIKDPDFKETLKTTDKKYPQIEELVNKDVTVNLIDEQFETNQVIKSNDKISELVEVNEDSSMPLDSKTQLVNKDEANNNIDKLLKTEVDNLIKPSNKETHETLKFETEKINLSQLVEVNENTSTENEVVQDDSRQLLKIETNSSDKNLNNRTFELEKKLNVPIDSKTLISDKDKATNNIDRLSKTEVEPSDKDIYDKTNLVDDNTLEDKQQSLAVNGYASENTTIKDSGVKLNQELVTNKVNGDQQLFEKGNLSKIINSFNEEKLNVKQDGTQTFKLSLQPDKLGDLEILLDVKDGKISAKFLVESEKVRELIKSSLPNLQEGLMKQNMVISKAEVSLQTAHNNFQFNGDLNHRQQHQEKMTKSSKLSQQYEKTFDYQDAIEEKQIDSVDILV